MYVPGTHILFWRGSLHEPGGTRNGTDNLLITTHSQQCGCVYVLSSMYVLCKQCEDADYAALVIFCLSHGYSHVYKIMHSKMECNFVIQAGVLSQAS